MQIKQREIKNIQTCLLTKILLSISNTKKSSLTSIKLSLTFKDTSCHRKKLANNELLKGCKQKTDHQNQLRKS